VLCCSVFQTHSGLDALEYAPLHAVAVIDGDVDRAQAIVRELLWQAWQARDRDPGDIAALTPLPQAIHDALAMPPGPVVIADRNDAVTAGYPGDSVELLRAMLALAVREPACVIVNDPTFARVAAAAGVGATVSAPLGGQWGGALYGPLEVAARVRCISDGMLLQSQEPLPGHLVVSNTSMGLTTVVEVRNAISVVVTSVPVMSTEPTIYRSVGVEPRTQRFVLTKSIAQQRLHFPFAVGFIDLDASGWGQTASTRGWQRRPRTPLYPDAPLTDTDIRATLGLPAT
jgi:microcystin degradation protein MlrC